MSIITKELTEKWEWIDNVGQKKKRWDSSNLLLNLCLRWCQRTWTYDGLEAFRSSYCWAHLLPLSTDETWKAKGHFRKIWIKTPKVLKSLYLPTGIRNSCLLPFFHVKHTTKMAFTAKKLRKNNSQWKKLIPQAFKGLNDIYVLKILCWSTLHYFCNITSN